MDNSRNGARAVTETEQEELEKLMDKTSLASIVDALAAIARDKAAHLREAWQDERSARAWDRDADKLDSLAYTVQNF